MSSKALKPRTPRTPQACERCRRSKTKCTGERPQCRSCMKRKVTCSWANHSDFATSAFPKGQSMDTSMNMSISMGDAHPSASMANSSTVSDDSILHPSIPEIRGFVQERVGRLQRLFDLFLAKHHDVELCSFFHKPSLDVAALYGSDSFLVNSVCALAALYIPQEEANREYGHPSNMALSYHYTRLAKIQAAKLFDEPSVRSIQAYLVLAVREHLMWSNVKAYMYAGIAIRMSQALSLNVEPSPATSIRDREIQRRTFWACFIIDRLISCSCNKPFAISLDTVKVSLPCSESAFMLEEDAKGPVLDDMIVNSAQVSQVGFLPFFVAALRLWGDMTLLHVSGGRRKSKHGPHEPSGEFYQHRVTLANFISNMPASLTWSPRNFKAHQIAGQAQIYLNICFLIHHTNCVMNQEYLPQLESQYSLASEINVVSGLDAAGISFDLDDSGMIKPCIFSINTITEMSELLNSGDKKHKSMVQSSFAANAILTASAVHLWVLYTQSCDVCPKHLALAKAESLRQIMKSWQPQWKIATAYVETLEMLYKLYVFSYGKIVESELDCWDVGVDDINEIADVQQDGDAAEPYLSAFSQRLYDKVKAILTNPLLPTEVKKRNLRAYSSTLWQHMWTMGPLEGLDDEIANISTMDIA